MTLKIYDISVRFQIKIYGISVMAKKKPSSSEKCGGCVEKKIPIFCQKVRARRIALGLTQRNLADLIGAPQPRVNEIESGHMTSDCDRIIALARALETTPDYLFGFRDEP